MDDATKIPASKAIAPLIQVQAALRSMSPNDFEKMTSSLLQEFIGVSFQRARSGSQRGSDATAMGPRAIRMEARRYGHGSRLDERSITGQIIQSIKDDPCLELWVLATTRDVPAQLDADLVNAAESEGVAYCPLDWNDDPVPRLAAICSEFPTLTRHWCPSINERDLIAIQQMSEHPDVLVRLKRQLESWGVGYEAARSASAAYLKELWSKPARGRADFNQDVAGGHPQARHLRREAVYQSLNNWWQGDSPPINNIALVGRDGAGKTWSALDWLLENAAKLPLTITIPSSAVGLTPPQNSSEVLNLLGNQLYDLTDIRTPEFWTKRIRRMLNRPTDEGPVFCVLIDGLNEAASRKWVRFFKVLQAQPFHQQVVTLATVRPDFFNNDLNQMQDLVPKPKIITVEPYSLGEGEEFEKKLQMEGLSLKDLPTSIIDLACVPRFFDLVLGLRDRLGSFQKVTAETLILEYGRSKLSTASAGTFSVAEFENYVIKLARAYQGNATPQSRDDMFELATSAGLDPIETRQRVSALIHGFSGTLSRKSTVEIDPEFARFSLAFAILEDLGVCETADKAKEVIAEWLDPLTGFDQRSAILSAVFCLAKNDERELTDKVMTSLLMAWLTSQNLEPSTAETLLSYAETSTELYLTTFDNLMSGRHETSAGIVFDVLASLDRSDHNLTRTLSKAVARLMRNIHITPLRTNKDVAKGENAPSYRERSDILDCINLQGDGTVSILGYDFFVYEGHPNQAAHYALSLLQGRSLVHCEEVFLAFAIHDALTWNGRFGTTVHWLANLNVVDPIEMAEMLGRLKELVSGAILPVDDHVGFRNRIMMLLLIQTGLHNDEAEAYGLSPIIGYDRDYERDYASKPFDNNFPLEHRHAFAWLEQTEISLWSRLDRVDFCIYDTDFELPESFRREVIQAAQDMDVSTLQTHRGRTREDLWLEKLLPVLARVSPEELAALQRRIMHSLNTRKADAVEPCARHAEEALCLVNGEIRNAATKARGVVVTAGFKDKALWNQTHNHLLMIEVYGLNPDDQIRLAMGTVDEPLYLSVLHTFTPPTADQIAGLIDEFGDDPETFQRLLNILTHVVNEMPLIAFNKLYAHATSYLGEDKKESRSAWTLLSQFMPVKLAQSLVQTDWHWSNAKSFTVMVKASGALIKSIESIGTEEVFNRAQPFEFVCVPPEQPQSTEFYKSVAQLITTTITLQADSAPTLPAVVTRDLTYEWRHYDITVGETLNDDGSAPDKWDRLGETEDQMRERRISAFRSVVERINSARQKGHGFYLRPTSLNQLRRIVDAAPDEVDKWMEGLDDLTFIADATITRLRLADGFYRTLCRVLLDVDPERGVILWHHLRSSMTVRVLGAGQVEDLVDFVFAAENSPPLEAIRDSLWDMSSNNLDDNLIDLIICTRLNKKEAWLRCKVEEDLDADDYASRKRATWAKGLIEAEPSFAEMAKMTGWPNSKLETVMRTSAKLAYREKIARNWYNAFIVAENIEVALATFILFEHTQDRRSASWKNWRRDLGTDKNADGLVRLKWLILQTRGRLVKKQSKEKGKKWSSQLAGNEIETRLWPWNNLPRSPYPI